MSDEVDFMHADKHESLLQIDTMVLMGMFKHFQSFQNSKFPISQKRSYMKLIFYMQINMKITLEFISTL